MWVTLGVAVWVEDFLYGVGEGSRLWRISWGVEVVPPLVLFSWYGLNRSLVILSGRSLGMLAFFPPLVFIER